MIDGDIDSAVAVVYLGYDWAKARTAVDTARDDRAYRGKFLRIIETIDRKIKRKLQTKIW